LQRVPSLAAPLLQRTVCPFFNYYYFLNLFLKYLKKLIMLQEQAEAKLKQN
jgi:hypothetical protein